MTCCKLMLVLTAISGLISRFCHCPIRTERRIHGDCYAPIAPIKEGTTITVYPLPHKQALYPESGDIPFTGSLQIRAGSGFRRYYTWDGETRWVDLEPREKRWYGSFGAYCGGPGSHWKSNHGITR